MNCEDCGTKIYNGICSNCHEESYIEHFQGEFMGGVSDEWRKKTDEQKPLIKENRRKLKQIANKNKRRL